MRTIRPKDEQDNPAGNINTASLSTKSAKRRCISSACIPCRKRKSKCDGGMPNCSTCIAVYQTPCSYDVDGDHRRKAALKRDIETLKGEKDSLGIIVASIRSSSDAEVIDIVQQIRADEDLETLAETLKKNVTLPERSNAETAEGDLSNLMGRPSLDANAVVKVHYGHTSGLSLVSEGAQSPSHSQASEPWTSVTQDWDLIKHLMDLYFCWSHPAYALISKELFWDDFTSRRNKYCSPLLVNAILAVGCLYSDRTDVRTDPNDHVTSGDQFFAEAKKLLFGIESPSLTTCQALAIMSIREASCNRDSNGFQYSGRCVRMVIELGLHLSQGAASDDITPNEIEARKITFWGCFILETAWSICIGRISQLPRAAINVGYPSVIKEYDSALWNPYNDHGIECIPYAEQPVLTQSFTYQLGKLTEIVNDTIFMFYAPRERFTSRKLLDFHARYKRWYSNLPESLDLREVSSPHVFTLHMYYHTVVQHLFRPFLKVDLTNPKMSPREICTSCANQISDLLRKYRNIYGFRRVPILMTHSIFSSSIIHLLDVPNPKAVSNLALDVLSFREISYNHRFTTRCLQIILALAAQWHINLPPEVLQVAYDQDSGGAMDVPPASQNFGHDEFIPLGPNFIQQNSTVQANGVVHELPFVTAVRNSPRPAAYTRDFFWSPFDESVPLQANPIGGVMDISAMVDVSNDWDQLNRDGFRPMAGLGDPVFDPRTYNQTNGHWNHV